MSDGSRVFPRVPSATTYASAPDAWPPRTATAPPERVTTVEDPELVRVRGLLYALRPERTGPLGGSPEAPPTGDCEPSPRRIVVQGGSSHGGLPAGLFATAPRSPTLAVTERLVAIERELPGEARTLRWLRVYGALDRGLVALYRQAGLILATADQREAWKASDAARREGPRVAGRELVLAAADVWDGRALDTRPAPVLPSR